MAEITITVNEDEIAQLVVSKIVESLAKEYSVESRDAKYGIRKGTEQAVKNFIYANKDMIIEKCVSRASAELVRKGLTKLLERMD